MVAPHETERHSPSSSVLLEDVRALARETRDTCLWFLDGTYLPSTLEEARQVLRWIERHGDRDTYVRARELRRAIPTNSTALEVFRREVLRAWLSALRRRGQRDRMTWAKLNRYADRWIPRGRVQHPWPTKRFDAMIRGRSPVR